MECLGPQCASMVLEWLKARAVGAAAEAPAAARQGVLWTSVPYQEEAPAIRSAAELAGAFEHLEYAVFRRYQNQLTRAERARLDNTIENALFKIERYRARLDGAGTGAGRGANVRQSATQVREGRERAERLRQPGPPRRPEARAARHADPRGVRGVRRRGLRGARLRGRARRRHRRRGGRPPRPPRRSARRSSSASITRKGVVGSPELQKFLGTIHHTRSHKGFFVTTRTFSLAAEKFVAEHPIELIDGPRLVELVQEAIGPGARREPEPAWF